jgi:hypothetical protein
MYLNIDWVSTSEFFGYIQAAIIHINCEKFGNIVEPEPRQGRLISMTIPEPGARLESLYCAAEISGAQFRTKCTNFGNVPKKCAINRAIHASKKLLHNISSSSAHLESEESVSVARKHASVRKCALGSERSARE